MEIWKDVVGYEGSYEVSSHGRVRSLDHYARCGRTIKLYKGKILTPENVSGYERVRLYKNHIGKHALVHRLVCEAFIENENNYEQVNHINENKLDNRIENLEWCTPKYNSNHGTRNKRISKASNGKPKHKLRKKVMCVETKEVYNGCVEASKATNIHKRCISSAAFGIQKTAGGYHWKYI